MANFVDETFLTVISGRGGDGSASFRREKFIPFGGPDGGDGGKGGNIYFVASTGLNTLVDLLHVRQVKANNGETGTGQQRTGISGEDITIRVPVGTLLFDRETDHLIADIQEVEVPILVSEGGAGGLGNTHFKSSTNRAPRKVTRGKLGESLDLRLELRLLADVGLLGMPNAGKSSLIRAISAARPKVANYPFTTLKPHLGVVRLGEGESYVVADIPGLIAGASEGVGLGHQFLRHISRCKLLLHLVDVLPLDDSCPIEAFETISDEIVAYGQGISEKPRWVVLNKMDVLPEEEHVEWIENFKAKTGWKGPLVAISATSRIGTQALCSEVGQQLRSLLESSDASSDT